MTHFLDASFLFAVFCEDDTFHQKAREIIHDLNEKSAKVIASNISLSETVNLIFRLKGPVETKKFINYFDKTKTEVLYVNQEIFQSGCKILLTQKSKKGLNFFDCLHLATMKYLGIDTILTFDNDFRKFAKTNEIN